MAANLILPFSQASGALVQTQSTYSASSVRTAGNQSGIADPMVVNKALRQATAIAVGLAQFLADNQTTDVTDDLLAAALSTMISDAIRSLTTLPAGTIVWTTGNAALPNTVKVNGALLSRTAYAKLWAHALASGNISVSDALWASGGYSPGDGSTNFRIPDLRGYVLRAWDDGRGIDASRVLGSVQADQLLAHTHGLIDGGHSHTATVSDPGHGHTTTISDPGHNHSATVNDTGHNHGVSDPGHLHSVSDGGHTHPTTVQMSNESGSGNPWGSGGGSGEGSYTFVSSAASAGVSVLGAFTNIAIGYRGTGITVGVNGAATGLTVNANSNATGVGVSVASTTTGITVAASSGGSEVRTKNIALLPLLYYGF